MFADEAYDMFAALGLGEGGLSLFVVHELNIVAVMCYNSSINTQTSVAMTSLEYFRRFVSNVMSVDVEEMS